MVTGRWGGCPLPEDIKRAMEQEQRKVGLDKVVPPAAGGTASGQKDVSVFALLLRQEIESA